MEETCHTWLYLNGDEADVWPELTDTTATRLKNLLWAEKRLIEQCIIHGYFPEIVTHAGEIT